MYCRKCGKEIRDDAVFCEFCGTKVRETTEQNIYNKKQKKNGTANMKVPIIVVISSIVVMLIIGVIIGVTYSFKNNSDSADLTEDVQDTETVTESSEAVADVNESADSMTGDDTDQSQETADDTTEESVRTVQMGDVLLVDGMMKVEGAAARDWEAVNNKIIVVSEEDESFARADYITPEEILSNVNQVIGKKAGEKFELKFAGGDGDSYYQYTIVEILDIDVNDEYKNIMRNYLDLYYHVNSEEELDWDWLDTIEYNPEFLSGARNEYDSLIPVFCIEDVNGDGIQELFIAMENKEYYDNGTTEGDWTDTVYAGYTMRDGEAVSFTGMIGYKAGTCEPCENGVFRNHGHVSAVEYGESWEYLPPNGTELEVIESIYYMGDFNDDNNVTITHYVGDESSEISREELDAIFDKYPTRVLPYISLEDYFCDI